MLIYEKYRNTFQPKEELVYRFREFIILMRSIERNFRLNETFNSTRSWDTQGLLLEIARENAFKSICDTSLEKQKHSVKGMSASILRRRKYCETFVCDQRKYK